MDAGLRVRELVEPLVTQHGAEIYDIEHESGILRIMVDREGGIDVDTLGDLSQQISDLLDAEDPIPDSRYLLEVTSPGVERKLRRPEHFTKQIGVTISVKVKRNVEGDRRFEGRLQSVADDGIEIEVGGDVRSLRFTDIDTAKVVYDWSKDFSADKSKAGAADNSITKKKATAR